MAATDFDYIATRNQIIEGAFRIVGALEPEQNLTAGMLDQGRKALELLVKSWSNKHLFLWSFNQTSFPTIVNQEAYTSTLDQNIIGLEKAWVVDSNDDIPIEVVSYSRYLDFYDKETNAGRPKAIAYKPLPTPSFYVWPSPDAIYTVKALAVFPLKDLELAEECGDIPVRFQRALKYCLAEDLFDEYPGPMNERQYIQEKALVLFTEAKNQDVPRETTNEVRGMYGRRC
jgi:hypothetical protein